MKYELQPENRNCPDEELFADLRAVSVVLNKPSLTKDDYNKHGRFCAATMQNRFGSWNKALQQSGLASSKRVNIPSDELLNDLKRVAEMLGTKVLSQEMYRSHGKFSEPTVARAFGSWAKALDVAGLKVSEQWHPKVSDDELFSNMAVVWEAVGRQPKQTDFRQPLSNISESTYVRRFGSWRKALEAFVATANEAAPQGHTVVPSCHLVDVAFPASHKQRTPRDPSWRMRFLVNRRDRFTCRACGRSPATEPGVVLHVDHIEPWSKGGETTMENLQTLCQVCNLGKSDLPMNETSSL